LWKWPYLFAVAIKEASGGDLDVLLPAQRVELEKKILNVVPERIAQQGNAMCERFVRTWPDLWEKMNARGDYGDPTLNASALATFRSIAEAIRGNARESIDPLYARIGFDPSTDAYQWSELADELRGKFQTFYRSDQYKQLFFQADFMWPSGTHVKGNFYDDPKVYLDRCVDGVFQKYGYASSTSLLNRNKFLAVPEVDRNAVNACLQSSTTSDAFKQALCPSERFKKFAPNVCAMPDDRKAANVRAKDAPPPVVSFLERLLQGPDTLKKNAAQLPPPPAAKVETPVPVPVPEPILEPIVAEPPAKPIREARDAQDAQDIRDAHDLDEFFEMIRYVRPSISSMKTVGEYEDMQARVRACLRLRGYSSSSHVMKMVAWYCNATPPPSYGTGYQLPTEYKNLWATPTKFDSRKIFKRKESFVEWRRSCGRLFQMRFSEYQLWIEVLRSLQSLLQM
jgi:hypothetical protein